jgi:hypothetical protein
VFSLRNPFTRRHPRSPDVISEISAIQRELIKLGLRMPQADSATLALVARLEAVKATVAADAQEAADAQSQATANNTALAQAVTDIETAANAPAPTGLPAS